MGFKWIFTVKVFDGFRYSRYARTNAAHVKNKDGGEKKIPAYFLYHKLDMSLILISGRRKHAGLAFLKAQSINTQSNTKGFYKHTHTHTSPSRCWCLDVGGVYSALFFSP